MTRILCNCPNCGIPMNIHAEIMGLPTKCECGAMVIAPVDWTDLQGFVLIFSILYPVCALLVKQEWGNWLKWVGFAGIAFLLILIFEALPKQGHDSSLTSLVRGQVVGAIVLAFAGLTSLFYIEAQGLIPALDFLNELGDGQQISFFYYLLLDIAGLGWFSRLVLNLGLHTYAMIQYPTFYFPPITMSIGTSLFIETSHSLLKLTGIVLIVVSFVLILGRHAIRPVLLIRPSIPNI